MIWTDKIKTLDNKIKANKAQYRLDWETVNISALSSGGFDKYQYLTGEELIAKLERKPDLNIFHYARFLL